MNLFDTISQASLNDLIDDLLNNFHKEVGLDLDDPVNDYCVLSFDTSDGLDAGSEVIFNNGDELRIGFSNQRLALLGYSLRFYYYLLDKGDLDGSKAYGELQSFVVDCDSDLVCVPFTDDQVYLQKGFDLVMMGNTASRLYLSANTTFVFDEDCVLTAEYVSGGEPVESATITFYDGETVVGTSTTDDEGIATLTLETLSVGTHSFTCTSDGVYSGNVNVTVVSSTVMELGVTGDSFSTDRLRPFRFNSRVFVDWGDDTGLIEYSGGGLSHNYDSSGDYTVKVYGDITSLGYFCFEGCTGLTSITLPNSVTSLGLNCFSGCTGLTSITLPNSVTSLGYFCFEGCTGLTSITLEWNTTQTILTYNENWITDTPSALKFHIPQNTTQLYTNKEYPSDKLVEDTV